jgi:hypothetical protein
MCSCLSSFYEDVDENKCLPLKAHGQNCSSELECDRFKFPSFVEGVCSCFNQIHFTYDDDALSCKMKVGRDCDIFTKFKEVAYSFVKVVVEKLISN